MAPFFVFIVFVLISTFIRGLERAETRKRTIKPTVEPKVKPKVEPKESNVKVDRVLPTVKADKNIPSYTRETGIQRKKPYSQSNKKITKSSVLNGIIMAEILSPPKCKRR